MINGVLVERTVGDVLPQLQSNSDNMNKVLVELAKQYKTKQDDMEKWKVRYFLSLVPFLSFPSFSWCRLFDMSKEENRANYVILVYRKRTRSRSCSSEDKYKRTSGSLSYGARGRG
jgi:hypothetical protein